jgi:hypothetical protein
VQDLEPLAQASEQGQQLRDAGGSGSKNLPAPSASPDPWEAACLAMGAAMDAAAGSIRPSSQAQGPAAAAAGDEAPAGNDDDDDDSVLLALLGVC